MTKRGYKKTPNGSLMRFIHEVALPFSEDDCLPWPFMKSASGYATISIGRKLTTASRFVCTIAHGPPPFEFYQAAHSCGKGRMGCVNPNHLSWKTPAENTADKIVHGTIVRGEQAVFSKLTESQIITIRLMKGQKSQSELGRMFGVSQPLISSIQSGKKWAWVNQNCDSPGIAKSAALP